MAGGPKSSRRWWPVLLAIDTSTAWASLAVFDGTDLTAELTWRAERRHGDEIFPMLERTLSLGHASIDAVDRIAVATGPGSFTGIRIAIATAKGLARGRGADVVGVSTLDVLAYPHARTKLRVCPLLPAGKDEYYAAFYQERHRVWARRSPYMAGSLAEICLHVGTHTLFVGEVSGKAESALRDLLGPRAVFAPPASRMRRAGYLAELGWKELESRQGGRIDELEPIYVKQASVRGSFAQPFTPPPAEDAALGMAKRST